MKILIEKENSFFVESLSINGKIEKLKAIKLLTIYEDDNYITVNIDKDFTRDILLHLTIYLSSMLNAFSVIKNKTNELEENIEKMYEKYLNRHKEKMHEICQ